MKKIIIKPKLILYVFVEEKKTLFSYFCHLRRLVFDQSSPVHPVSELRGGGYPERNGVRTKARKSSCLILDRPLLTLAGSRKTLPTPLDIENSWLLCYVWCWQSAQTEKDTIRLGQIWYIRAHPNKVTQCFQWIPKGLVGFDNIKNDNRAEGRGGWFFPPLSNVSGSISLKHNKQAHLEYIKQRLLSF